MSPPAPGQALGTLGMAPLPQLPIPPLGGWWWTLALTASRHLRPDIRGLCRLQEDAATAGPAEAAGKARKEGKAKTQKTKQPPASTVASPGHRQVERLRLGSLLSLRSVPPSAALGPSPSKAQRPFSPLVTLFWVLGIQP